MSPGLHSACYIMYCITLGVHINGITIYVCPLCLLENEGVSECYTGKIGFCGRKTHPFLLQWAYSFKCFCVSTIQCHLIPCSTVEHFSCRFELLINHVNWKLTVISSTLNSLTWEMKHDRGISIQCIR